MSRRETRTSEDSKHIVPPAPHSPVDRTFEHKPRHIRQISTHTKRSSLTYRHFSLQPPPDSDTELLPGAEPGIDYQTTLVELQNSIGSEILVVDYSCDRINHFQMDVPVNGGRPSLEVTKELNCRPKWSSVRWINVNGLSSEAIAPITNYFNFHPLTVEDMVDIPQRTKIDVFADHIFACYPLHVIKSCGDGESKRSRIARFFRNLCGKRDPPGKEFSDAPSSRKTSILPAYQSTSDLSEKLQSLPGRRLHKWDQHNKTTLDPIQRKLIPELYRRKLVEVEQVSLFLTEDTVITFFEQTAPCVVAPLMSRMMSGKTILRQTEDPGILAQAIIATCVDMIDPIINEYSARIRRLQIEAIQWPTLTHTRALNVLLSDLIILRSSIGSICGMVNSFRSRKRQDSGDDASGYFQLSPLAVMYLGDVFDHINCYVDDLGVMHEQAKIMTTLIFNTISIKSSDAVRLLSLVTVVFLPLSFLTGYFGMNFTDFDTLNNNVSFYWWIAGPFTGSLATILTYPWISERVKNAYRLLI